MLVVKELWARPPLPCDAKIIRKIDLPKPKLSPLRGDGALLRSVENPVLPHEMTSFRPSFPPLLSLLLLASLPLPAHPFSSPFPTSLVRATAQRAALNPAAPRLGLRAGTRARGPVGPVMEVGDVIDVTWEVRRQPSGTGLWICDASRISIFRCREQGSGDFFPLVGVISTSCGGWCVGRASSSNSRRLCSAFSVPVGLTFTREHKLVVKRLKIIVVKHTGCLP